MNNAMDNVQSFAVGAAAVTIINVCDLAANLREWYKLPEDAWRPHYADAFENCSAVPVQSILIRVPEATVLIDPSIFDFPPDSPDVLPNYTPPVGLFDRLHQLDTHEDEIDHVIITRVEGGAACPCFPRAHCHIGRADWSSSRVQQQLLRPDSLEHRTLGVLNAQGLIELVSERYTIAPGIEIIPTPGETPGHLIVRVQSRGEVLYCLGDLYHHAVEVEQPEWMTHWADRETMMASRRAFVEAALAENALLIATHIPGVGRLESTPSGVRWKSI
jgi:hypothetical protein